MNCREARSLFSARVDGELSGIESASLENHLSICPPCAEEARSIASTVLLLRTMPQESPDPMFVGRVLDRVRGYEHELSVAARGQRSKELAPWWRRLVDRVALKPIPMGLALAVGAFAGFLLIQMPSGQPGPGGNPVVAEKQVISNPTTSRRPFQDLSSGGSAGQSLALQTVRNDTGRVESPLNPSLANQTDASAPVEVLAPDWWNTSAGDPKVQTVGTQSGGASVVVF